MTLPLTPAREKLVLWLLALIQFTVIMDFMVMMPLSPQLMQAFSISAAQFSGAVSAYAWCAGFSGLLAATYVDRFDRKRLLLTVFLLFNLSNLACAVAPNFHVLVLSRAFAGLTGGVLGAIGMAIIGDLIAPERRGYATGIVMTSFSMAAILGVPLGISLAARFGWQSPFYLLVLFSMVIWCGAAFVLPALTAHMGQRTPLARALPDLAGLFAVPAHLRAFLLTFLTVLNAMLVIPFISPVLVGNLGVRPGDITWIYMAGGVAAFFSSRFVGSWSDRAGKHKVYRLFVLFSVVPILGVTHLPPLPLAALICLFPFFMVTMNGRTVPLQALMTTVPEPRRRGAFLSANAAVQQIGTGLGALLGGLWLRTDAAGHISGYGINGWIAAALSLFTFWWAGRVGAASPRPVSSAA
ncbi:putative MFS family arabinose efflux permease [Pseudoduganella flava]|uniref:MFS transporter n=1 Tax=Pseudoduganella flava TaxID=871742 RepID=A0A562PV32_9BURK|nr:MFS transporter [Pseudoduganella flava]QGZ39420.1 MFS transporter [Pseudoduganella flava]TWI48295.1 putative MFS family arabinose efflux permease [Pseudoduganella flava]